jgi:hypothetical protein
MNHFPQLSHFIVGTLLQVVPDIVHYPERKVKYFQQLPAIILSGVGGNRCGERRWRSPLGCGKGERKTALLLRYNSTTAKAL